MPMVTIDVYELHICGTHNFTCTLPPPCKCVSVKGVRMWLASSCRCELIVDVIHIPRTICCNLLCKFSSVTSMWMACRHGR